MFRIAFRELIHKGLLLGIKTPVGKNILSGYISTENAYSVI
ncbi:hypothetical protein P4706_22355 [Peribacillus castrilensis]|uniref:Uncharacterized protein n=1 Tax=Peribacillus castrilensis TaxID=2897690 RepID=A0AAW9NMS9_9BACI|nr:hypothetical protein [Peribacillus castrilensis]